MNLEKSLYEQALQQFEESARREHAQEGDEKGQKRLEEFLASRGTAGAARDSAAELKADASKKYSKKVFRGKEIISEKWISNIMGNISNAISIGDFIGKGAPESVNMAWFCVKIGLNAVKSNYDLYSLYGSGLTAVTEIMILVPHYDELFHDWRNNQASPTEMDNMLYRDIVAMYAAVLDFCFLIRRHLDPSRLKQLGHAIQDALGARLITFQSKQQNLITLKTKVVEASEAVFKGRVSGQLTEVQSSLETNLAQIRDFAAVANEMAESQTAIVKELQELKATVKQPITRWDMLKQEFEMHKKSLDPIPEDPAKIAQLLAMRHAGTTKWVFETDKFTAWESVSQSSLLCLTGIAGSGKSIAVGSVLERCTTSAEISCYLEVNIDDMSQTGFGSDPLKKIKSTIIFQIYQHAMQDESQVDLLDEANRLFNRPEK